MKKYNSKKNNNKIKSLDKNILSDEFTIEDSNNNNGKRNKDQNDAFHDALEDEITISDTVDSANGFGTEIQEQPQDDPIHRDLELTLEEIRSGCVKKLEIKRKIFNSENAFDFSMDTKEIEIVVEKGSPEGKKFTFEKLGNQNPGTIPADLIYVVRYKPHAYFSLIKGTYDIIHIEQIAQSEAANGVQLRIPSLDHKITYYYYKKVQSYENIKQTGGGMLIPGKVPDEYGNAYVYFKFVENEYKDEPIEHQIQLSLEQIARGYCSRLKIPISKTTDKYGNDLKVEYKLVPFGIRAGASDLEQFTFSRVGRVNPNRIPADMIITLREKPHKNFVRKGANVEYIKTITESEATSDDLEVDVPTLYGDTRTMFLNNPVINGKTIVMKRLGMPNMEQEDEYGDLVVRFRVVKDKDVEIKVDNDDNDDSDYDK